MRKIFKKTTAMLLLATMVLPCVACGEDNTPSADVDSDYEWCSSTYTDTSELTSWADLGQTKQLKLTAWNTQQQGGFKEIMASDDVVYPEIERVTGVTIDEIFDNRGNNADAAWNLMEVTGDIPDIAYGGWVDPEACYDLTEYIDEYCPTIKSRMPESVWNASNINGGQAGKVYAIPYGLGSVSLSSVDEKADPSKTIMFENSTNYYPFIYVREDILEDAYGAENVYTTAELEAIYEEQGYFTEEQFFDVNITSAEDFRTNFLPRIYDTIHSNSKYQINGERWVECMLAGYGSEADTWDFMGNFIPALLGSTGNWLNTEFTYWDAVDQEVQLLIKEDFYQAELKEWVKLIEQGKYISDYGLLNGKNTISSELSSGYYAIGYEPSTAPNGQQATYKGETVKYRKVYLNIEKNEHFEFFNLSAPAVSGVSILKDSVKESDIPQILRWLDYQCSEIFDRCVAWGPKSAGLFTEDANGVRTFKDEDLAYQMVYSTVTLGAQAQKYNLCPAECEQANITFTFFWGGGSKDHPKCSYDLSSINANFQKAYAPSAVFPDKKPVNIAKQACIWKWSDSDLEGVETVWAKRPGVEKKLMALLRSGNSGYNNAWNDAVQTMNVSGWTDEYFAGAYTEAFLNLNEDYLSGFYKG